MALFEFFEWLLVMGTLAELKYENGLGGFTVNRNGHAFPNLLMILLEEGITPLPPDEGMEFSMSEEGIFSWRHENKP